MNYTIANRKEKIEFGYLAILKGLEACYNSNYYGGTPVDSILMFQSTKSCLTSCLAHHNYSFPNSDNSNSNQTTLLTEEKMKLKSNNLEFLTRGNT